MRKQFENDKDFLKKKRVWKIEFSQNITFECNAQERKN